MRILRIAYFTPILCGLFACTPPAPRVVTVREAVGPGPGQSEIDAERQRLYDSTKLGKGEEKPWKERYQGENPSKPFQGPPNLYNRR